MKTTPTRQSRTKAKTVKPLTRAELIEALQTAHGALDRCVEQMYQAESLFSEDTDFKDALTIAESAQSKEPVEAQLADEPQREAIVYVEGGVVQSARATTDDVSVKVYDVDNLSQTAIHEIKAEWEGFECDAPHDEYPTTSDVTDYWDGPYITKHYPFSVL